jgi:hypothetical protein
MSNALKLARTRAGLAREMAMLSLAVIEDGHVTIASASRARGEIEFENLSLSATYSPSPIR